MKKSRGFTLVELLVVIAIIVTLAGFAAPAIFKQRKKGAMLDAVNNARQINILMIEFDSDFGSFPSVTGDGADPEAEGTDENFADSDYASDLGGTNSNQYFRQFFAADMIESEEIFYAKAKGTKKPDGDIAPGQAVASGECGFAYLAGQSTSDNGSRPLIMTPMDTGTKFDSDPFGGKAVVLFIDGSVKTLRVNDDGEARSGKETLFSSTNPIWGDDGFDSASFKEAE